MINKRVRDASLPTLNLLGNSRLLFRVVICRSAMFSVPLPRFPNRSLCFGLKRRSNRTQASIRGSYGNRGCAAREICDDEEAREVHSRSPVSPIGAQRSGSDGKRRNDRTLASFPGPYGNRGNEACEVHSDDASGGPVSLAREKPGKERGRGVPLHPRCAGR